MDPRKPMYPLPDFTQRPSSKTQPTPFAPMRPIVMRPILPNGAENYFSPLPMTTRRMRPQYSPLPSPTRRRTQSLPTGLSTMDSQENSSWSSSSASSSDSLHSVGNRRTPSPPHPPFSYSSSGSPIPTSRRTLGTQFPSPSRTPPGSPPPSPSRTPPGSPPPSPSRTPPGSPPLGSLRSSISESSTQSIPTNRQYWEPPKLIYDPDHPEFRGQGRGQLERRQVTQIPGDPFWGGWRGWDMWDKVGKKTRKRAFQYNPADPPNRFPDDVAIEDPFRTDPTSDRMNRFEESGLHSYWAPNEAEESVHRVREPAAFRRAPFPMPTSDTDASRRKSLGQRLSRFGSRTKKLFSRNRRHSQTSTTETNPTDLLDDIPEESLEGTHSRTQSMSSLGTQFSSTSGQTRQQRSSKGRDCVCRCRRKPCLCRCGFDL